MCRYGVCFSSIGWCFPKYRHWVQGILLGVLWEKGFTNQAHVKSLVKLNGFLFCKNSKSLLCATCIENTQGRESQGMGSFLRSRSSTSQVAQEWTSGSATVHREGGLLGPAPRIKSKSLAWPPRPYQIEASLQS